MDVDEVDSDDSPVRARAKAGKKKRGAAKEDPKETPAARRQQQQQRNDIPDEEEERDEADKVDCGVAGDPELVRDEDGAIRVGPLYIPPPPPPALTFESGDRPRLVITHIENENFKSYAGKQTLGPFHKSFSSIVGPNGSGKSNVIDSMLFVFGYRAQQIRSKKISVLIHNSERHQDVQSCCVRVFFQEIIDNNKVGESFDKDEEVRVVPESQFSVSRTAFSDNSSHYEVNGKRLPFKEVAALLRRKGIDLDHNRFLILQGEVEQIALMKPKGLGPNDTGMLEYLEDIIGSSRFRQPLELIKDRVTELDEHRGEKLNRVKLVEKEKDELEGPMNEAMAFLKLENEIVEKKNLVFQNYTHLSDVNMAKQEEQKAKYQEGAKEVLEKVNKYETRRKEKEEQIRTAAAEVEKIRKNIEENVETLRKHDVEHTSVKEEMKADNAKRHKLKHLLKQEQEKYEKLQLVPEANAQKITECETHKETLMTQADEEQAKYDKAVASLNAETKVHQVEKEKLETKLVGLKQDSDKKKADLEEVQNKMEILRSTEAREKSKLEQFRLQSDQAESSLATAKERTSGLEKDLPAKRKEQQELQAKLGEYQEAERDSRKTLTLLEASLAEKRSSQQATRSRGRVHEALMRAKADGRIPGIFGRLGDLGTIDEAYDVAISNAAAGSLDVIVTDTIETSTECIKFLKKENLGRGTFFALDMAARHSGAANARNAWPENVPRLCDLVRLRDERFRNVFYQYLGDTLVASNIDQGQRIAFGKKRYRVVVTTGEVFETSGASTGGGKSVLKGLMGTQQNSRESDGGQSVDMLERQRAKAESDYQAASRARAEAEHRLSVLAKELQGQERELERLRVDLRALDEKRATLKDQIKNQERVVAEVKPDQNQLDELGQEEARLQAIYDEAKVGVDEVQFSVQKLNKTIKDIMGGKLKAINKKLEETKSQLEKVKSEITRLQVEVKTATRNIEKSRDKVDSYQTEITEVEEKMRKLKTKMDELVVIAEKINQTAEEVRASEKEKSDALAELQAAVKTLSEKENRCLSEKIKVDQKLSEFDTNIKEEKRNKAHWERELKKLKLREIPGVQTNTELKKYEPAEMEGLDLKQWQNELNVMEENLAAQKPNLAIIEEYRRKETLYLERVNELDEITARRDRQRKNQDELRKMRVTEFLDGFYHITSKLKEMYQMITLGGDAELELVDSLDPFSEGIVFSVRPPKKSWKNISNLSGGEKTLSSLALVFALHYYRPTPLYVMDEIDAALDFKNVSIVANYIRERTKNAQFIIVSLRSNMFELADRLVGIYKTYHCTKSVTINPGKIAESGAAAASATAAAAEVVRAE